ncbi:UDP-glucose 6-dehydrogenase [bacterium]|nr:MAG: UDP-glucose 6-dehydrogenase [bacterium]
MARICIVGTGYVGLVSGACFADFGHEVWCVDINPQRIDALKRGEVPFFEPGLEDLVARNHAEGRLHFTTVLEEGARAAEVVMIAVQTPPMENGEADLQFVMQVGREIAALLQPDQYKVICTKSTVPVGTAREVERTIREHAAKGASFDVASNPEFLREGSSIEDFMRPDRVVIGTCSEQAEQVMRNLYRPLFLLETPIVCTDLESSELVKYASNAFLAVKISYINEIAALCEKVGAQVDVVARAMGLDGRIGRKFLHAGLGFGGSCLPKDTKAIVQMGRQNESPMRLIAASMDVNDELVERAIEKAESLAGPLKGKRVALLGLAFKPNTDDVREAPALRLVPTLRERGASVVACDPEAEKNFLTHVPDLELADGPYSCVQDADVVLLVTEWNPYRELNLSRVLEAMRGDCFIDCRNVYAPARMKDVGFSYDCFGRPALPA